MGKELGLKSSRWSPCAEWMWPGKRGGAETKQEAEAVPAERLAGGPEWGSGREESDG